MLKFLKIIHRIFTTFFFDPLTIIIKLKAIPSYFVNSLKYSRLNKNQNFNIKFLNIYFTTFDKYSQAGDIKGHYFFQDLWAAKKIYESKILTHYDIGSRIDGFIAHILPFCEVNYVDIRKLNSSIRNLNFIQGNILSLPFEDNSIESLSCLHVIEHIGLGRYGDDIDPEGYKKAAKELCRVLAKDGKLYFATPIGKEKLYFDAHRVFSYKTILKIYSGLKLLEFNFIPDEADRIIYNAAPEITFNCDYGCGLFVFTKIINDNIKK